MNPRFTSRGTRRKYRVWPCVLSRLARLRIERRERVLAGLTTRGNQRQRRMQLPGRANRNARLALQRKARYALGLTARGTPRKMFTKPFSV